MAGDGVKGNEPKFTGLAKYFNSYTDYGRGNTAKLTYAVGGVIILYTLLKPKKKTEKKE